MARYRARRRGPWLRPMGILIAVMAVTAGAWWFAPDYLPSSEPGEAAPVQPQRYLTSDRPEREDSANGVRSDVAEKGETSVPETPRERTTARQRVDSLLTAGREALQRNELIAARTYLSEALKLGVDESQANLLRADLTSIGNDTLFSPRILPDDPLCERYIIQPGDSLGKIAKANQVSAELLASVNGIPDINRIRAGQTIKIIKGPFHAVVRKSTYTLDVYLGTTFAKHFKVGLGAEGSTPMGQWQVSTKLKNPTFYPPRGGNIVAADDPRNPLGERWIGLVGISGEAVGQMRYGIHGTIEPESIGQSVSMGCIRMHNQDVEALYTYLVEKHSTVTVQD